MIAGNVPNLIDLPKGCRFAPRCLARTEEIEALTVERHPKLLPVDPGHDVRCWLYQLEDGEPRPTRPRAGIQSPRPVADGLSGR